MDENNRQQPTPAPISNDGQTQITAQPPTTPPVVPTGRPNQKELDRKRGIAYMALALFMIVMGVIAWPIGVVLIMGGGVLFGLGAYTLRANSKS